MSKELPPGQRDIPYFVIYRILGQPTIDIDNWRFTITGLVKRSISLDYDTLLKMIDKRYTRDFHCVTGWTVRDVYWEGVSMKKLIDMAEPLDNARWAYIKSADGYTTVVPFEDIYSDDAILALKMNGEPLQPEHGYPARIFIPHLYGWKSAKWVVEIELIDRYRDGYWEALGYHERGYVWKDERFKEI